MTLEQHNFNQAGNLVGKKATRTALLKNFNLLRYLTWDKGVFEYTPESKERLKKSRERNSKKDFGVFGSCKKRK